MFQLRGSQDFAIMSIRSALTTLLGEFGSVSRGHPAANLHTLACNLQDKVDALQKCKKELFWVILKPPLLGEVHQFRVPAYRWGFSIRGIAHLDRLPEVDKPSPHEQTVVKAKDVIEYLERQGAKVKFYDYLKMLKRCIELKDLAAGRQVHKHINQHHMLKDQFIYNTVINMYVQCGSLDEARQTFDQFERTVHSWNTLIVGYAQDGQLEDAFSLLSQMQQEGLQPDRTTFMSFLNACQSPAALEYGREVHAQAARAGLLSTVQVSNCVINMYAKCGSVEEAWKVFEKMEKRTVVTWTMMIGGYAGSGQSRAAFDTFQRMQQQGIEPNQITYLSVLNAFSDPAALEWGKAVHAHVVNAGYESNAVVGTALMKMYAKCGSYKDCRQVFERLVNRDLISWNTMIGGLTWKEASEFFLQMQREGITPNKVTYVSLLNTCVDPVALHWGRQIHSHVTKAGYMSDLSVANALISMYGRCGSVKDARHVFDKMGKRDIITWTTMIRGFAKNGLVTEAWAVFQEMQRAGVKPNRVTYMSILDACSSPAALEWGKRIHRQVIEAGLAADAHIENTLVAMYSRCDSINDARQVFDRMSKRDVVAFNAMIGGYAAHNLGKEAFKLLSRMEEEGVKPDKITYVNMLNACANAGSLEWTRAIHARAMNDGLVSDTIAENALVSTYAKCGCLDDALQIFDRMKNRNTISWNAIIGGLAQHGRAQEALQKFEEMKRDGFKPDAVTFVSVLSACSHAGLLEEGRRCFASMAITPTIEHYGCMVDLLGRAGLVEEAEALIRSMPMEPNTHIWGALLGACQIHGNISVAERAAGSSLKLDQNNAAVYVSLTQLYAAAGMWDAATTMRALMEQRGITKEPGRSSIEVDGQLHHFVAEDRSHPESEAIYAELKRLTGLMKEAGYTPDTRFVLHDVEEHEKENAVCHHSEKLAIAYGMIRTPPGTPIRLFKNLRVCPDCHSASKFISRIAAREIVARDASRFHHFRNGVCSCGDYW